jgi:transposase
MKGVLENFGNAQVVVDTFHVVSQVVAALEEVRRKEAGQRVEARPQLERSRWLWRKNPESWTAHDAERREQLKDKPALTPQFCPWTARPFRVLRQPVRELALGIRNTSLKRRMRQ